METVTVSATGVGSQLEIESSTQTAVKPLRLGEGKKFYVGVDLGGTKIYAGLTNREGNILATVKELTITHQEGLAEQLPRLVERLLEEGGARREEVAAIGVGSPGPLDPDRGIVFATPNLSLHDFPLVEIMESHLKIPTFMDNDVNVATLGEALLGAGEGKDFVVGIFVGTGIGGGIVLNGRIYHGASKNGGEIGHMVILADGPACGCGGKGHLEALASKTAMARQFEAALAQGRRSRLFDEVPGPYDRLDTRLLQGLLDAGDDLVTEILIGVAHYLALGCVSLIHVLGPDVIVLGGGVMEAVGDFLLPRIKQEAFASSLRGTWERTEILPSALGDDAGLLGAVTLAKIGLNDL